MRDKCDAIRLHYRLAKAAETTRIRIDHGLVSFARVYLTSWKPGADEKERKKDAALARETVHAMLEGEVMETPLAEQLSGLVYSAAPARNHIVDLETMNRKAAVKIAESLPAWDRIGHAKGFSSWGLVCLIGEAGDLTAYSGRRKLYKRLGLAPDECYPTGEKKTGRMIPRNTRGRIMGVIADPLLRAQWRGEREDAPAHAIGPYGQVYWGVKARALASGKVKGHADKLGRRAMVKALIHDVWAAWHGQELTYAKQMAEAA